MKAERLELEFRPRSVRSGGFPLLRAPDAVELVNRAAEEGVPILGVDGVRLDDDGASSPSEHVADYSSAVAEGHGCWAEAEAFIRERERRGLVFELTLGDDPIEAV